MRAKLADRRSAVAEYLPRSAPEAHTTIRAPAPKPTRAEPKRPTLATYYEDLESP